MHGSEDQRRLQPIATSRPEEVSTSYVATLSGKREQPVMQRQRRATPLPNLRRSSLRLPVNAGRSRLDRRTPHHDEGLHDIVGA